ncbi:MAG: hypothetical protein PUF80_08890, partial [Firmicutes bacterium]|nr:hypothetical protein [Bacillota bacterium]
AFYLANLDREVGKEYRMQWREEKSNWSAYHTIAEGAEELFALNFYVKGGTSCEHNWVAGTAVAPTCEAAGYTPYTCSLCDATKKEAGDPALGHDWVADAANSEDPTCTAAGVNAFACSRCDATKTEVGDPALGHIDADENDTCDRCGKDLAEVGYVVADSVAVGDKIVIVAAHSSGTYAVWNDLSVNNALNAKAVTLDGNEVVVEDDTIVWEVVAGSEEGTFMLKGSDGNYMAYKTTESSTLLRTADAGTDFEITCGKGTSRLMAALEVMADRGICFRKPNDTNVPQFRMYKTSNTSADYSWDITIYKLG